MKIVGLTSHLSGNHDNSAAVFVDGRVLFAESEERVSRIKHDRNFPVKALIEGLSKSKLKLDDIDYFASGAYETTPVKLFLSYLKGYKYTGTRKFLLWFFTRIFLAVTNMDVNKTGKTINSLEEMGIPESKLILVSHYLAHAETAYQYGGMDKCLVIAWDGYGINDEGKPLSGTVYRGENGNLTRLEEVPVYTSVGLYYGAVTVALGFKLNDGEGKTMGLAAFGKKSGAYEKIKALFPYFSGTEWIARKNWLEVNGVSRTEYFKLTPTYRYLRGLIEEHGAEQVAWACQRVFEEEGKKYFKYLVKKYKQKKFAAAGGVFLNVKFNALLLKDKIVDKFLVYPNPGDGGVAVGAAIAAYKKLGFTLGVEASPDIALGCSFSGPEIKKIANSFKNVVDIKYLKDDVSKSAAKDIASGKVIGWFQGRGEWGPRALGHRSVLADPRRIETKERINDKLKQRDWFMPFAPAILKEYSKDYLAHGYGTPYMTLTDDIKKGNLKKIPAAIHIDSTARTQIVSKDTEPLYWQLISDFHKLTGVPVLLNTSFNRHGLPIVHSPKEAIEHLIWGCIDSLYIGSYVITRKK